MELRTGISSDSQNLLFGKTILDDDQTLVSYGIGSGDELRMFSSSSSQNLIYVYNKGINDGEKKYLFDYIYISCLIIIIFVAIIIYFRNKYKNYKIKYNQLTNIKKNNFIHESNDEQNELIQ